MLFILYQENALDTVWIHIKKGEFVYLGKYFLSEIVMPFYLARLWW